MGVAEGFWADYFEGLGGFEEGVGGESEDGDAESRIVEVRLLWVRRVRCRRRR